MFKLENIQGGYTPGSMVLQGIDLVINPGEVVGIIGLNGCGKSTLGKAVMNLIPFRTGGVIFNGQQISNISSNRIHDAGISMVMQGGRIFPHMTIWEHFQFASNNKSDIEIKKRLKELEEQYELYTFIAENASNRRGSYLSGGEKQQLSLIMALLNKPHLLILDEISAGLSPSNLMMITNALEKLKDEGTISIMLIEQNIKLATQLSNRLLLLERGIIDQQYKIDVSFDFNILNENIFN